MNKSEYQVMIEKHSNDVFQKALPDFKENLRDLFDQEETKSLNLTDEQKEFFMKLSFIQSRTIIQASTASALQVIEQMQSDS